MATVTLQFQVNVGAVQTSVATVVAEDEIDLRLASYSGLQSIRYEIQEYPDGFAQPTGWSTDGSSGAYYFNASSIAGLTPPTITMPTAAEISGGQWGKWIFRAIGTTASGTLTSDPRCGVKIVSPALGLNGIAFTEEAEFNTQRAWAGDVQEDLVEIDGAALVSGGFVSAAAATRPIKVSGSTGSVTWSWEPNANVGMLGYGFTACPSVVNAGGGLALTAGAGAASLAGSTTATVSAGSGALTLEGATDVAITATTDDVLITAADAITATATGALTASGATATVTASGGNATLDASAVVKVGGTSATRVELGRSGQTVRHPALAGGGTRFVTVDNNGDEGASSASGAPSDAYYLVTTANGTLTNEIVISAIGTTLSFASSSTIPVQFTRSDVSDDSMLDVLDVRRLAGTPGDVGIGTGVVLYAMDAGGDEVQVARVSGAITDATAGAHDSTLTLWAATAGTLNPGATLDGDGNLAAVGSVTAGTGGFLGVSLDRATSGTFAFGPTNITALTITPNTTCSGTVTERRDNILTTVTPGIIASNTTTTASPSPLVQYGPAFVSSGGAWETGGGGSAKTVRGGFYTRGLSSGTAGTEIVFIYDTGGGSFSEGARVTTNLPGIGGVGLVAATLVCDGGNGIRFVSSGTDRGNVKWSGSAIELNGGSNPITIASTSGTTINTQTITPRVVSAASAPTSSASAVTFNLTTSQNVEHAISENTTVTITGGSRGQRGLLVFTQDGTGRTITMPSASSTIIYDSVLAGLGVTAMVDTTPAAVTLLQYYITGADKVLIFGRAVLPT